MKKDKLAFSKKGKKEILQLHNAVAKYMRIIADATISSNSEILNKAVTMADSVRHLVKEIKSNHLTRLAREQTTPLMSLVFMDIVSAYRRLKDHTLNIAEVLAGEK